MSRIIVLDETTANQIAAGEVVERPVSVVKELVENSLDAGATRIIVELTQGGLSGIKVVDNGCGMSPEDAMLCWQRHATSKIRQAADLNRITTLGFRGEALPSIASVAKLTLTTRAGEDLAGTEVLVEAGQILRSSPVGCPAGTTIEVKELFFNTPARRKYLKSPHAEAGQVSDLINRLALARPDVRIELRSNGRVVFFSPGNGSLRDTATAVFGADNVRSMIEVNYQGRLFCIKGLISKPVLTRASRQYQSFFINGRYIRSGLISSVLQQAYQTQIPSGRFPIAVLHISLDPTQVDVNVHPTKMEVRLAQEKEVAEELLAALSEPLNLPPAITGLWEIMPGRQHQSAKKITPVASSQPEQIKDISEEKSELPPLATDNGVRKQLSWPLAADTVTQSEVKPVVTKQVPIATGNPIKPQLANHQKVLEVSQEYSTGAEVFPNLSPVGQVLPTYVLAQGTTGLYIIDQHAAHERVLYEKYLHQLQQGVQSQVLLNPLTLQLSHHEAQLIIEHILEFSEFGFILEHFGGDTFLLRGVPPQAGNKPIEIFMDLLTRLQDNPANRLDRGLIIDHLAAVMACRDAIKAGQRLGPTEIMALLDGLAECQRPFTCPHGRPTIINITHEELKKRFKR